MSLNTIVIPNIYITGVKFYLPKNPVIGTIFHAQIDRNNNYDTKAIAVKTLESHNVVGYLTRQSAQAMYPLIEEGHGFYGKYFLTDLSAVHRKDKQDLRKDFMETVKKELNVQLEDRDVVAIHRIPSQKAGPYPVIVKLFSSDVKRQIMRCRKELTSKIRFVDDVTQRNMSLIERLRKTDEFESVWYFNCGIYGRTPAGLQLKFGLYDDIHYRVQQGK
ncbi:Hypothetical predicted protein [Mytilus galloprovincialis]|uniref:HIRAN domain-containing protein n=1 Tax=Mytilus galloprovincialis TaxID=29158 RepID=A0A8B6FM50_MYTGA|nr:Hypothetical predicted protein [Mytilus galloprovincialis]